MMTPRRDIVWLDINDSTDTHGDVIRQYPYSRFPVADGSLDRIPGVVDVRDLWIAQHHTSYQERVDLRSLLRQPLFVPDRSRALDVLEQFQKTGSNLAIVIDDWRRRWVADPEQHHALPALRPGRYGVPAG